MPLPPALESLMRATPPMGRSAPGPDALAGAAAAGGVGAGGAPGAPSPAPSGPRLPDGGGTDPFASVVAKRMSDSGAVDPNFFLDQLSQMKTATAIMLQKSLLRYPGQVDKQIQGLLRSIDAVTKAFQEAQAHQAALSGPSPIDFAGAQTAQPPGVPATV